MVVAAQVVVLYQPKLLYNSGMDARDFFIKKKITACSAQEAIAHESQGDIVEVWTEKTDTKAIGFIITK